MFSKLQGMRPAGKRPQTNQNQQVAQYSPSNRDHEEEQLFHEELFNLQESEYPKPSFVSSTPPILPPIPRVASQYGPKGPSFADLERRFGSHGVNRIEGQQDGIWNQAVRREDGPAARELISPAKASDLPLRREKVVSSRAEKTLSAHFSRPLQSPPQTVAQPIPPRQPTRSHTEPALNSSHPAPARLPPVPAFALPAQQMPVPQTSRRDFSFPRPPSREAPAPPPDHGATPQRMSPSRDVPPIAPPPRQGELPIYIEQQNLHDTRLSYKKAAKPPPPNRVAPSIPPPSSRVESSQDVHQNRRPYTSSGIDTPITTPSSMTIPMAPSASKSSKPMLNRLNPMSFLGRKRSNQPTTSVTAENNSQKRNITTAGTEMPADYDPRIRGSVVHDFSAPRAKPPLQDTRSRYPRRPSDQDPPGRGYDDRRSWQEQNTLHQVQTGQSDRSIESERQHTPVFKEHFGEHINTWRFDQDDPRNKVTTSIMDRLPLEEPEQRRSPLPPFARKLPENFYDPLAVHDKLPLPKSAAKSIVDHPLPKVPQDIRLPMLSESKESQEKLKSPNNNSLPQAPQGKVDSQSPPTSPPNNRSRSVSVTDPSFQSAGLPKHLRSNASRFSFDLAGVGSAVQEKLLEDKHRQKTARRARASTASGVSIAESQNDSEYDMEYDDGLEEDIPTRGIDADDDEFAGFGGVANSTLYSNIDATKSTGQGGGPSSWAVSQPIQPVADFPGISASPFAGQLNLSPNSAVNDPSIMPTMVQHEALVKLHGMHHGNSIPGSEDDDLYFDDGMIDELGSLEGETFDESVFDDDHSRIYGLPLRDLQPLPAGPETTTGESSRQSTRPISMDSGNAAAQNARATADTSRTSVQPHDTIMPAPKSSLIGRGQQPAKSNEATGLTEDNLAAYHDALAFAANKAASEGRFERKASADDNFGQDGHRDDQPHVTFNEQELCHQVRPLDDEGPGFHFDDDDDLDDDAIIAAANAEALENDDDGFYGQEFGFYARSSDNNEEGYVHGGYFGSSNKDILKRSHSGRDNGQEPCLTPITERSEWSQRNSMISLAHGNYPQNIPTQGISQLADALKYEEDDMSLSALIKLRRGAWGASATSLHSGSGGQKTPSPPVTAFSPSSTSASGMQLGGGAASIAGVGYSFNNSTSAVTAPPNTSAAFPLTGPGLRVQAEETILSPTQMGSSGSDTSPKRRSAVLKGHSRNSSGAESVSYIKEQDEDGSGRWVVEMRRTGEGGQVELLGRQVVEGGRI